MKKFEIRVRKNSYLNNILQRVCDILFRNRRIILLIITPDENFVNKVIKKIEEKRACNYLHSRTIIAKPCPCGFYGCNQRECVCTYEEVRDYQKRVIEERIIEYRLRGNIVLTLYLTDLSFDNLDIQIKSKEKDNIIHLLKKAFQKGILTTYSDIENVLEIAETISEIENSEDIKVSHISEALNYIYRKNFIQLNVNPS